MKRTEIEAIARQLVRYVETHPQCKRSSATMSIPAHIPTIKAWSMVKHLFDYKPSDGERVGYSRNNVPFGFVREKRIAKNAVIAPSKWTEELTASMQKLVNESYGITGEKIREVMQINMVTFKRVSRLIKAARCRVDLVRGMTYYPIDLVIIPRPPSVLQYKSKLDKTVDAIQSYIDSTDGVSEFQIRIQIGIDVKFFKKCVGYLRANTSKNDGITTYYKLTTQPPIVKSNSKFKYVEMAKTDMPILTQWRIAPPWLSSNTAN